VQNFKYHHGPSCSNFFHLCILDFFSNVQGTYLMFETCVEETSGNKHIGEEHQIEVISNSACATYQLCDLKHVNYAP
jgi:hypothetical protein